MRPLVQSLAMRPPPERRGTVAIVPLLGLALVLAVAAGVAGVFVARDLRAAVAGGGTTGCGLPQLGPGTHLALVGAAGGGVSNYVIPGREAARTGEVDLLVTADTAPVFLVLFAHDPLIWRLGLAPGARLAGVAVFARHPQVVAGAPAGIAVRRFTGPGTSEDCRTALAGALAARGRDAGMRAALGRDPDSVQLAERSDPGRRVRAVVGSDAGVEAARLRLATEAAVARLVPRRGPAAAMGAR